MFMRYVKAKLNVSFREFAYRIYVTDALKVFSGVNGRYYDMINIFEKNKETRAEDEVRAYYKNKINELQNDDE